MDVLLFSSWKKTFSKTRIIFTSSLLGVIMGQSEEKLIIVNDLGHVTRFSTREHCKPGEYIAVVLVLVFLPHHRQLILFKRAAGAGDMQDHWALMAGKLNSGDCFEALGEVIGNPVSLQTARNAAIREFKEELNIEINGLALEKVKEFTLEEKGLHFSLLALAVNEKQAVGFLPNTSDIDAIRRFSIDELIAVANLGDAILCNKNDIISYLESKFY
jgi:8-oxo-dGTP pyrophosphatase MutT (NUDIX family)